MARDEALQTSRTEARCFDLSDKGPQQLSRHVLRPFPYPKMSRTKRLLRRGTPRLEEGSPRESAAPRSWRDQLRLWLASREKSRLQICGPKPET